MKRDLKIFYKFSSCALNDDIKNKFHHQRASGQNNNNNNNNIKFVAKILFHCQCQCFHYFFLLDKNKIFSIFNSCMNVQVNGMKFNDFAIRLSSSSLDRLVDPFVWERKLNYFIYGEKINFHFRWETKKFPSISFVSLLKN